jgi:hypothetical protein
VSNKDEQVVTDAAAVPGAALTHKQIMIILSGLMTAMLLAALDQTIVSTALKRIVEDFNGLDHVDGLNTALRKDFRSVRTSKSFPVRDHHFLDRLFPRRRIAEHD